MLRMMENIDHPMHSDDRYFTHYQNEYFIV